MRWLSGRDGETGFSIDIQNTPGSVNFVAGERPDRDRLRRGRHRRRARPRRRRRVARARARASPRPSRSSARATTSAASSTSRRSPDLLDLAAATTTLRCRRRCPTSRRSTSSSPGRAPTASACASGSSSASPGSRRSRRHELDGSPPGIGIDLIEIDRIERALERRPRLAERLFTEAELAYARARRRPGRHLAARFAAKEAAIKALGGRGVAPRDVEVVGSEPPRLALHGRAAELAAETGRRARGLPHALARARGGSRSRRAPHPKGV